MEMMAESGGSSSTWTKPSDGRDPERSRDTESRLCLRLIALARSLARSRSVPLRSLALSSSHSLARSLTRSLTRSRWQGDPVSVFSTRPPHVAARRRKRRARHLRDVGGPRRSSSCPSSLPSLSSSPSCSCFSRSAPVYRGSSHFPAARTREIRRYTPRQWGSRRGTVLSGHPRQKLPKA